MPGFDKIPLKIKLLLLIVVPIAGLLWFSGNNALTMNAQRQANEQVLELVELSIKASLLTHELQKERGLSAGYLSSKGARFRAELGDQRDTAGVARKAFTNHVEQHMPVYTRLGLTAHINAIRDELNALDQIRTDITSLNASLQTGISFYTRLNSKLIYLTAELPRLSTNATVTMAGASYFAFLQSKERSGIERAVLAATFASDNFAPGMANKFIELVAEQNAYADVFLSMASALQADEYRSRMNSSVVVQTDRMRAIAMERAALGGFGVDSSDWFKAQTAKINLLREVEMILSDDLSLLASGQRDSANTQFSANLMLAGLILLFTAAFGQFVVRRILRQLGTDPANLQTAVSAIASNDLEIDLGCREKSYGILADMQTMQANLIERTMNDKKRIEENNRIRQALNMVDGNVMIVDENLTIIYFNRAMSRLLNSISTDLKTACPGINPDNLAGLPLDRVLANQSEQLQIIRTTSNASTATLRYGNCTLSVVCNAVFDKGGKRLGTAIEWTDRTQELTVQDELQQAVSAASAGVMSQRIRLDNKDGFYQLLSTSVNELMDVSDKVLNDTIRVVGALSRGNLGEKIVASYQGSFNQLKQDTNATVDKLIEVVGDIQSASDAVKSDALVISDGNSVISERSQEQAANLEQTASRMEEMTTSVSQNAENAKAASKLAETLRDGAMRGGTVIESTIEAMQQISESTGRISDIIGVIDDIAFQTNLLALNASVEAARAGEQGRGFAVVASEVRNLAGRSAAAAKEIKNLIQDGEAKVSQGSTLVTNSGDTLKEIVTGVEKVTNLVSEISTACQEQSIGIQEAGSAISELDINTRQNTELVEQAAGASDSLREQAVRLSGLIQFFDTSGNKQAANVKLAA